MVLSKGKKIILIAVAAVVVLAAAFFAWRSYSETQETTDRTINCLLDEFSASFYYDPYDPESAPDFIAAYWNSVKDRSSFQRELADRLDTEILALTLQNAKAEPSERAENQYDSAPLPDSTNELLCKLMSFLDQVSYEDEGLRDRILSYYQSLAELERTADPGLTEAEQELAIASGLTDALDRAAEFDQAAGDFYLLSLDDIAEEDELVQHYDRAIQLSRDAGDRATFAQALSAATSSPVLEGQTFLDSQEIVDFLMEDGGELYALRNGVGGYYDTHALDGIGQITYYGDFARQVVTSGGGQYDMSEMSPEIWGALTQGQRDEITSGNRVDTNYYYYLRGEGYDGSVDLSLGDEGYDYVYLDPDGSVLYCGSDSIAYPVPYKGSVEIYGDFSEQLRQAETQYSSGKNAIREVASALALGEYETAIEAFLSVSDNGSDFSAVDQLASELAKIGALDEGMAPIYEYLDLTVDEMIQLEISMAELHELYG